MRLDPVLLWCVQEDALEKLKYDLYYVKHMSTFFDLMIILETIKSPHGKSKVNTYPNVFRVAIVPSISIDMGFFPLF
jgi:hypothetical protein